MSDYIARLATAESKLASLKEEIVYLKLQIKQEKRQIKWAKASLAVQDIKSLFPEARIDNGAGVTYISIDLAVTDQRQAPEFWQLREREQVYPGNLGSPIRYFYRIPDAPINVYLTRAVR